MNLTGPVLLLFFFILPLATDFLNFHTNCDIDPNREVDVLSCLGLLIDTLICRDMATKRYLNHSDRNESESFEDADEKTYRKLNG
ncbi:hypothetical protein TNCV_3397191 [Trichonephila clavipes]|nr:hypothetical protein TNCV_3397191 [Trichonephila clavipes]